MLNKEKLLSKPRGMWSCKVVFLSTMKYSEGADSADDDQEAVSWAIVLFA